MAQIDPKDVLRTARKLAKRGDFAGALEKYVWIHRHAVEHDVLFHGVRLSYALYEWLELGEAYPRARLALIHERDKAVRDLRGPRPTYSKFQDLVSMNEALNQDELTSALFRELSVRNAKFAQKNLNIALDALMVTHDYELILSVYDEPNILLGHFTYQVNMMIKFAPNIGEPYYQATKEMAIKVYLKKVGYLFTALAQTGARDKAKALYSVAIDGISSSEIRERVATRLKIPRLKPDKKQM